MLTHEHQCGTLLFAGGAVGLEKVMCTYTHFVSNDYGEKIFLRTLPGPGPRKLDLRARREGHRR